jgi:hypothetical protein
MDEGKQQEAAGSSRKQQEAAGSSDISHLILRFCSKE